MYLVVREFEMKATVPYTAAKARIVWDPIPRLLYKVALKPLVTNPAHYQVECLL